MGQMARVAPTLIVLFSLAAGQTASARVRAEVQASVTGGYTNLPNPGAEATTDPNDPTRTIEPPGPDAFFELSPGATLVYRTSRVYNALAYAFYATFFVQEGEATSYSNSLTYTGIFDVAPALRLSLGVAGRQGRQGAFRLQQEVDLTQATAQPDGDLLFVGVTGRERLDWQIDGNWDVGQALEVDNHIPLQRAAQTLSVESSLGLRRRWELTQGGVNLRQSYLHTFGLDEDPPAAAVDPTSHWLFTGTVSFRRDLTQSWSVGLEGGGQIALTGDFGGFVPSWLANGRIDYRTRLGQVALSGGHGMTPNALIGEIFETDYVDLRGGLPIGPRRWRLYAEASAGYSYGRSYELDPPPIPDDPGPPPVPGDPDPPPRVSQRLHMIVGDVALTWRFSAVMEASLRYQLSFQKPKTPAGERCDDRVPPLESDEVTCLAEYTRHTVLFTLRFNYPPTERRRRRRRIGNANRVDREEWDTIFDPTPGRSPDRQPAPNSSS